ncbi:MAG: hypothetical protein H0T89_12120 [Deltaproteobacteria bacterium]|nr:hypothetical protein [Deltaproteobacteria bacterium]
MLATALGLASGCAADPKSPGDLETRLAVPVELAIGADASLGVTVVDTKDEVVSSVVPRIERGQLTIDATTGRLRVLAFTLELADLEVAADLTGLATPLRFVDVTVSMPDAPAAITEWSEAGAVAVFEQRLQLDWSLAGPRGPSPLAAQLVRVALTLAIETADDGALHASLHAAKPGAVWHFGELSLRDLDITVAGSSTTDQP